MEGHTNDFTQPALSPWDPNTLLPRVTPTEIEFSRGFLRCQPGQWFPGFSAQWLTLTHSLGLEIKLGSIIPTLQVPTRVARLYAAKVGDQDIALAADDDSLLLIGNAVVPGSSEAGRFILEEYLARRLLASLVLGWAGPQAPQYSFKGKSSLSGLKLGGGLTLGLSINGFQTTISLLLGPGLIEQLDGMWRRQIRSSLGERKATGTWEIDLAQLAVRPASLADYSAAGTVVDLEIPVSDGVMIRTGAGEVLAARLRNCEGEFVLEMSAVAPPPLNQPEGTTRLAVRLGTYRIDPSVDYTELLQPGTLVRTGLPAMNVAALVVGAEQIARAQLCVYSQRFAMTVL